MSTTGTKKPFAAAEVCAIIKTCGEKGVRKLTYQGLTVEFNNVHAPTTEPVVVPQEITYRAQSQARETLQKEEVSTKQEELDLMLIEDPERFEELLRQGDLVDERN